MRIVVLAGGIGGARFLVGVRAYAAGGRRRGDRGGQRRRRRDAARPADLPRPGQRDVHAGRRRRPRARAGAGPARPGRSRRSWPRTAPSRPGSAWATRTSPPTWCARTMLDAGYPLSAVTEALCARWQPGVRLLPATDDRVETHVVVDRRADDREAASTSRSGGYATAANCPTRRFVFVGAEAAKPAPGVLDAIGAADVVLVAPSNPVVSIAPILAVPGLREAVVAGPAPVVGVSPDHRRRPGARHGRPLPGGARRGVQRRPGWAGSTARAPTAACSTAGWSTAPTRRRRCRA